MTPIAGTSGSHRRGTMAPPTAIPSSSTRPRDSPSANAVQSLYASILAPPPAKRARTIHNPEDPPVPAPPKMTNGTPRPRRGSEASSSSKKSHSRKGSSSQAFSSVAERTRAQSRHRREDSDQHRDTTRRSKGKGRKREAALVDAEDPHDIDMKAAATLTHLLRHSRSSIVAGANAASPRSSISAGSDLGSVHAHAHFAQSSTRTTTAPASMLPAAGSSFGTPGAGARPKTPPLGRRVPGSAEARTTPKMGSQATPLSAAGSASTAVDQEAVSLLTFFHESPSPARPTTVRSRDAQDAAAYRALGGADLKAKGRVLFGGGGGGGSVYDPGLAHRLLARDNSGSFASTATLVSDASSRSRLGSTATMIDTSFQHKPMSEGEYPTELKTTITPPTPIEPTLPQLHPMPSSPTPMARPAHARARPTSPAAKPKTQTVHPTTPGTYTFNLNEFINVSPSPAAMTRTPGALKPGLRGDGGRKLFEEEQQQQQGVPMGGMQMQGDPAPVEGSLGAGIHLARY